MDGVPGAPKVDSETPEGAAFVPFINARLFFMRENNVTGSNGFCGNLDDVRLSAGCLSPDRFLKHRSDGLVALWRFDSGTLDDFSGNGHELVYENGPATFGDGGNPASGTGVLINKSGSEQWLHTKDPLDLLHTKAATIEVDYYSGWSGGKTWPLVSSSDVVPVGGFVLYNPGSDIVAQFRTKSGTWQQDKKGISNGHHQLNLILDGSASGSNQQTLYVDGEKATEPMGNSGTVSNLLNEVFCIGHAPVYSPSNYLQGKFITVAVSDVALEPKDSVISNLPPRACSVSTLAQYSFRASAAKDISGQGQDLDVSKGMFVNQALVVDSATRASRTMDLSPHSQITVEAFVRFDANRDGALLSYGEKGSVGSFSLVVSNGTLIASAVPYAGASVGGSFDICDFEVKSWHHIAIVLDQSTRNDADRLQLYVDYKRGELLGRTATRFPCAANGVLSLGASVEGGTDAFPCRVDDLRISSGVRPVSEMLQPGSRTEVASGMVIVIR